MGRNGTSVFDWFYLLYDSCYTIFGGDFMNEEGNILFKSKSDSLKNGIVFILLGIGMIIGSNFIYAKAMALVFGFICIGIGLYFLVIKKASDIIIYENSISIISKAENKVINKKDIKSIEHKKLKSYRTSISSYYPVLVLKDNSEVFINIAYNFALNKEFKNIITTYLD